MINRLRRGLTVPVGSGETAGFAVKESNKRIGFNLGHVDGSRERYIGAQDIQVKTAAFTVKPQDDGRTYQLQLLASFVVTLPSSNAASRGMKVTVINDLDPTSGVGYSLSPAAADFIGGANLTRVADKDLINTQASANLGDFVTVQADGAGGWHVVAIGGTWAKQA